MEILAGVQIQNQLVGLAADRPDGVVVCAGNNATGSVRAEDIIVVPLRLALQDTEKTLAVEAWDGDFIVDQMAEAIRDPANHPYSFGIGMEVFRETVVRYFERRFGVGFDHKTEVIGLLGSKEGIGHLPTAIVNPGEVVLCPEPGYPVYVAGTIFAGGEPYTMPLRDENGWLPILDEIPADVARRAKLMYLNYPNNPTAALADRSFIEKVVA